MDNNETFMEVRVNNDSFCEADLIQATYTRGDRVIEITLTREDLYIQKIVAGKNRDAQMENIDDLLGERNWSDQ